mgnify:CR=1 FL=1
MSGLAGQTSLFPPEPAPDPLLCWLWLAHVLLSLIHISEPTRRS